MPKKRQAVKQAQSLTTGVLIKRLLMIVVVFFIVYQCYILVQVVWWINHNPSSTAFMRHQLSVLQAKNPQATIQHRWVPYARISTHVKRAVITAEDAKFMTHRGFDWDGIKKAYDKNLKKGKLVAGGSSISQQLAKNLFLSPKRSAWRKFEEVIITIMLESMLSKQRIFEIYLNVIEWGNGVFGIGAAANHYYQTSAGNLSQAQAAKLASMIPNPRYYDLHRSARGLNRKTTIISRRMHYADTP